MVQDISSLIPLATVLQCSKSGKGRQTPRTPLLIFLSRSIISLLSLMSHPHSILPHDTTSVRSECAWTLESGSNNLLQRYAGELG